MPVRVLLSKYRSYDICSACDGARLKPESLLWRLGNLADADQVLILSKRFKHSAQKLNTKKIADLPGLAIHDVMLLPVAELSHFFEIIHLPRPLDEANELFGTMRRNLWVHLVITPWVLCVTHRIFMALKNHLPQIR